jgi:deoxyribose-phosphate aldolase
MLSTREIAKMLDHSLLKPELTVTQMIEGCRLARRYGVAAACVKPSEVARAREELEGSGVLPTTVVGFPHGANRTEVKVLEAELAIRDGARELDMVLNIGRLLSRDFDFVEKDIKAVVDTAHTHGVVLKVILETCFLSEELKIAACRICERVGADFVKNATGFGPGQTVIADLSLMKKSVSEAVKVKAAGGLRTLDAILPAIKAGAVRFGTTASNVILDEAEKRQRNGTLDAAVGETGADKGSDSPLD